MDECIILKIFLCLLYNNVICRFLYMLFSTAVFQKEENFSLWDFLLIKSWMRGSHRTVFSFVNKLEKNTASTSAFSASFLISPFCEVSKSDTHVVTLVSLFTYCQKILGLLFTLLLLFLCISLELCSFLHFIPQSTTCPIVVFITTVAFCLSSQALCFVPYNLCNVGIHWEFLVFIKGS